MNVLFLTSLFISLAVLFLVVAHRLLTWYSYRMRIRKLVNTHQTPTKKRLTETKSVEPKQRWLQNVYKQIDIDLQAASIPIKAHEFFLTITFLNVIIWMGAVVFGAFLSFILSLFLNLCLVLVLSIFRKRRKKKLGEQLPYALELISNALKSGYSIVQTIDLVGKENFVPLSEEFQLLFQSLKYGESLEQSLLTFNERLDLPEVQQFVDSILITRETGGNVTVVIDGLLQMFRENEQLQREVKTVTAQSRMSAWIVGALPPGLFLFFWLLNREYMTVLFTHPLGYMMIGAALLLELIGIIIINRIINMKVG